MSNNTQRGVSRKEQQAQEIKRRQARRTREAWKAAWIKTHVEVRYDA